MNMFTKSLMVISVLSLTGFAAYAQQPVSQANPIKEELKKDNQEVQQDKEQLKKDVKSGATKEKISSDKKSLRDARMARKADRKKMHEAKEEKKETK